MVSSLTPYYYCVNRCVRRAFLCGEDRHTGSSYTHRKQWIVDKIRALSSVFAIDVCAYAVMSSHYHVVLHVDESRTLGWDDAEVTERWKRLFRGALLVDRYLAGRYGSEAEAEKAREVIGQWRVRLAEISWYMRCLNEHIARLANREDGCKGRFWEERFKSQALLDETALLACMAYVDLNPIRAGLSETLEGSDYTSIQARIQACEQNRDNGLELHEPTAVPPEAGPTASTDAGPEKVHGGANPRTAPFVEFTGATIGTDSDLPFHFADYLDLVDWTGRAIRADKRGFIPAHVPPILTRLELIQA